MRRIIILEPKREIKLDAKLYNTLNCKSAENFDVEMNRMKLFPQHKKILEMDKD